MTEPNETAVTDLHTESPAEAEVGRSPALVLDRNPRAAWIVFAVIALGAIPLYLWAGRHQWFFLDEWDFLAGRRATSLDDLLRPHNEHWSTLPILVYRLTWNVFGLRTYWPYQLLSTLNHLAIAALLLVVMRRAQVAAWIATVAACAFVLYGTGAQNIVWGFQIQFASPLTFGLVHLLLADHDGPIDRRDWIGLAAGAAALMSSGLGAVMVIAVGLAVLLRRGAKAAAFHTLPLAAVYLVWWLAYGRDAVNSVHATTRQLLDFVSTAYRGSFRTLGMLPLVGVLLAMVLVVGLTVIWSTGDRGQVRRRIAGSLGLLVGGIVFALVTGWGRGFRDGSGDASRYMHVLAALVLPALAIAIDALYRRWRIVGFVGVGLLLAGIPGNVLRIMHYDDDFRNLLGSRDTVLALGSLPFGQSAPRDLRPLGTAGPEVTMGWVQDNVASGKIPQVEVTPSARAPAAWLLTFEQTTGEIDTAACAQLKKPVRRELRAGDEIHLRKGVLVIRQADRPLLAAKTFSATDGQVIRARADVTVDLTAPPNTLMVPTLCE